MVKIETRCRIPIWWTFGRIQWHVIPEPPATLQMLPPGEFNVMIPELRVTLQGAATWWIHCHNSRTTCHIAGCSHLAKSMSRSCHIAGCKNSIRHIENRFSPYLFFLFIMQFRLRLWRAAAFVSSPIQLLKLAALTVVLQSNSFILSDERLMTNCCVVPARWTESCHDYLPRSFTEIRSVFRWSE